MTTDTTDRIRRMRTADLRPNELNPRGPVAPESVGELADSLAESGMLCPILVRPNGEIVAGHRRHAAATLLGREYVPVTVTMELDETAVLANGWAAPVVRWIFERLDAVERFISTSGPNQ